MSREIQKIIIHCSATKEGVGFCASDIDQWHKDRGWKCIGYHFVIGLEGTIEKGREIDEVGAHCLGQNKNSIGICYIGGLDKMGRAKDTRTQEQKEALSALCERLHEEYPEATFHGHKEFEKGKDCPCFEVQEWLKEQAWM